MTLKGLLFFLFKSGKRLISGRHGRGLAKLPILGGIYRAILVGLKPRGLVQVQFHGLPMMVNADDDIATPILMGIDYNDPEIALCRTHIREGMFALDIGANMGCFTLIMARQVGATGQVYAFEPAPGNLELLRRNVALNRFSQATVVPKAVADESGVLSLYLSPTHCGDHRIYGSPDNVEKTIPVEVVSLDEFFGDATPEIHFLKIDIQGAEPKAFRGMKRLLAASPRLKLLVEFDPPALRECGEEPEAFLRELFALGFRLYHVSHDRKDTDPLHPVESVEEALRLCSGEFQHINLFGVRSTLGGTRN